MALLDESRPQTRARRWPSASDDALVRGACAGDEDAFAEIFSRYHGPLVRYCRGILLDPDLAQDAAQNALASALRALRSESGRPRVLGPWLYRIAQREAVDLARRRRADTDRRPLAREEELLHAIPAPATEQVRERLRDLVGDLARLPLRQRSALLLRELSGLDYADIGVALQTTPAAARQSVLEARRALADVDVARSGGCASVHALVDAGDRRRLRARRVRAHLDHCADCRAFAARIEDRRRDLALLFPLAPALASGGSVLAALGGGGAAAGGAGVAAGGAGLAAGGWSLGIGASGAAKCALACTAAIVGIGSIAERGAEHHPAPASPIEVVAQAPQPSGEPQPSAAAVPTPSRPATRVRTTTAVRRSGSSSRRVKQAVATAPASAKSQQAVIPAKSGLGTHRTPTDPPAATPTPAAPAAPAPPAAAPTPPVATAVPMPSPAPTPKGQTLLAEAVRKQAAAAIAQATAQAAASTAIAHETVKAATSMTQQAIAAAQQITQQVTHQALTSTQQQLTLLQRILRGGSAAPTGE